MTLDYWSELTISTAYAPVTLGLITLFGLEPDPTPPAAALLLPAKAGFTLTYAHYACMWLLFQSGDRVQRGTESSDFYTPDGRFKMFASQLTDLFVNGYATQKHRQWVLSPRGRAAFLDERDLIALDPIEYAMAKNELAKHKLRIWETYYKRPGVIDWLIIWQPISGQAQGQEAYLQRKENFQVKRRRIEAAEKGETKTIKRGGRVVTVFGATKDRRIA